MNTLIWRCVGCGEQFDVWWLAEDHVDNICDAPKLELVWPDRACTCAPHDRLRDGEHPNRCYRCSGSLLSP